MGRGFPKRGAPPLCDVVICPQLQPPDFIVVLVLGGDHDNGHLGKLPNTLASSETVHAGKSDVQKHQGGVPSCQRFQGFSPLPASATSNPSSWSTNFSKLRVRKLSSTTRTRVWVALLLPGSTESPCGIGRETSLIGLLDTILTVLASRYISVALQMPALPCPGSCLCPG